MSDRLEQLGAALSGRAPQATMGWRAGAAVSNAQFLARARAWSVLLRGQRGSNFALYLDDSIEFGAALLGAWHAGKTIWLSADTLPASCAALQASVDGFLGQFPSALAPLQAPDAPAAAALDPVLDTAFDAALNAELDPDFRALVVFTSGSTGAAQAIPKKLSQLASEVATLQQLFGAVAAGAAVLATVSHQHIYGLLFKVLWPLSAGRALHALSIAFPEQLAPALAAAPCVLVASPAHLKRLPEELDWRGAARQLRAVFSSGGPLAAETAHACARLFGQAPVEVYGSSETGGVAWRQRGEDSGDGDNGGGDSWLPFPTVEWRLAPDDDTLQVRSPHLPDSNWLALADRAMRSGHSGHIGHSGHSGDQRFLLLGRSDRIVKIEEKRISLDAMEAALIASALAAEARVVVCEPAAGQRQTLAAFVVPTAAGRALLADGGKPALNQRLRAVLGAAVVAVALPRRWRYLNQLPVNAQGKTTLASLLALLDDGGAFEPQFEPQSRPQSQALPLLPQVRELEFDAAAQPQRALLELTAAADLLYFDGHFSSVPILPGVAQVEWAVHYGRRYFSLPPQFHAIHALKFQQVIRPDNPVRLELLHDANKGSLQFRYFSDAGQHASGRILLRGEGGHG